jgi:putative endonuclease
MTPESPSPANPPAPREPRHALGALGEDFAVGHFRRLDFVIVERNVRTRHGEIDLIAFDGRTLVFAEVKTRRASNRRRGLCPEEQPLAWLKFSQRSRLKRLACAWLYKNTAARPKAHTIRFDAVGVIVDGSDRLLRLDHIEGAW